MHFRPLGWMNIPVQVSVALVCSPSRKKILPYCGVLVEKPSIAEPRSSIQSGTSYIVAITSCSSYIRRSSRIPPLHFISHPISYSISSILTFLLYCTLFVCPLPVVVFFFSCLLFFFAFTCVLLCYVAFMLSVESRKANRFSLQVRLSTIPPYIH